MDFKIFNFAADAAADTSSAAQNSGGGGGNSWMVMVGYVLVFGALIYFMMVRPNRKRQKQETQLRESIQVGDEIVTTGGIFGRVVSIKEDSLIIESPADRTKMRVAKWAVQSNLTVHDEA